MSKTPIDGFNPLRKSVRKPSPLPSDPLEQARRYAADARDIARDERRRMPGYDADTEEITKTGLQTVTHVHVHQHSQPDIDVESSIELGPMKVTGLPKWAVAALGLLVAAGAAIVSHFVSR